MSKPPKQPEEDLPSDIAKAFSMNEMAPLAGSDTSAGRARAEREGMIHRDGRSRRRLNRTEPVTLRTTPEVRATMTRLADALGLSYVQVFEMAISGLDEKLRDQNK